MKHSLICTLLAFFSFFSLAQADEFVVLTSLHPPFCINKGVHVTGVSVDALEEIFRMTGKAFDRDRVKLVPWKKGVAEVRKKRRHILMNVPRTKQIEHDFKWVGPIYISQYCLIGKNRQTYSINNLKDADQYRIGSTRGSLAYKTLLAKGVDAHSIKASASYVQPLLQLKKGEIDLFAYSNLAAAYLMHKMHIDSDAYSVVYQYSQVSLYYAFNKDTSDEDIELFNEALEAYKKILLDGESAFEKQLRQYLPDGPLKELATQ